MSKIEFDFVTIKKDLSSNSNLASTLKKLIPGNTMQCEDNVFNI